MKEVAKTRNGEIRKELDDKLGGIKIGDKEGNK